MLEFCSSRERKGSPALFDGICGKECVNNHLKCGYKKETACTISREKVKTICDGFVSKNIFSAEGDVYSYHV